MSETANEKFISSTNEDETSEKSKLEVPVIYPFRMKSGWIEHELQTKQKDGLSEREWIKVCTRIDVVAATKDANTADAWGRQIEIYDADGVVHNWAMPMSVLAGDFSVVKEKLYDMGMILGDHPQSSKLLIKYLSQVPSKRVPNVNRIGWQDISKKLVFVLPNKTYGWPEVIYQSNRNLEHAFNVKGALEAWNEKIGAKCELNSNLTLGVSAALAATLLKPSGEESFGVHFRGSSSIGKTTLLRTSASVSGGGAKTDYIRTWRTTDNALEGIAHLHCDNLLCMDEIGQVSSDVAANVAYMLASGSGKNRAGRDGFIRVNYSWRTIFLSTGEISLATKIEESGKLTHMAGHQVRVIDLPADTNIHGIFDDLCGFESGGQLAEFLNRESKENYGLVLDAFLYHITLEENRELLEKISIAVSEYASCFSYEGFDGQVQRVAKKFALLVVACDLAIRFGILKWKLEKVIANLKLCFDRWIDQRGSVACFEENKILDKIRQFIELHGDSRFLVISHNDEYTIHDEVQSRILANKAGYKLVENKEITGFCFTPNVFASEICKGFDRKTVLKTLAKNDLLVLGEGGRNSRKIRVKGLKMQARVYHVKPEILSME